jgi:glucose/arabinose dehydrogenase
MARVAWLLLVALLAPEPAAWAESASGLRLDRIRLPAGFRIAVYAYPVPNARQMALGARGTLFVGSRSAGRVYALRDEDGDFAADRVRVVAEGLAMPSGVAFKNGALYVAEIHRILRFDEIESALEAPQASVVTDALPRDRHHGWKFIAFGPDGKLYVPVGAPCNVCEPPAPIYAALGRMNPDGTAHELIATGIRNTVGFDWDPATGALWFTDNGRDLLGDDLPPDELNVAVRPRQHFGFPACHGRSLLDPRFGFPGACEAATPPAVELGPHVAALGMRFYRGSQFPGTYRGRIFIAEHGSWNRSTPLGYRITTVQVEGTRAGSYEVFAEGWLAEDGAWGRPADVLELPDGSLLVADDHAGAIYRITYSP